MSVIEVMGAQRSRIARVYRGWWIVILTFFGQYVMTGSGGYVFGVMILPMQRDLGWSQSAVVAPLLLNRWLSALLAVPLGPLVDRYGTRLSMTLSALLAGTGLIMVSFARTPLMFYGAWAMFGLAQPGMVLLGSRVVIANWFVRKRAQAFVVLMMGGSAAGLTAAPTAALIAERDGWRAVWLILGLLCYMLAPLCWWAIRKRPEDLGLLPDGATPEPEAPAAGPATGKGASSSPASDDTPWSVREALRTRSFWFLTGGFLLVSMPSGAIFINISGFVQSHGFSTAIGASVVSTYALGSLCARPLWGFFLSRVGLHRTLTVFASIYSFSILVFAQQSTQPALYAAALFLGFGISGSQLLNAQAVPDYYGRRIVGALTGYSTLATVAVGGSAPQLTAFVFDRTGSYVPALHFFAAGCAVAAVAFIFAPPPVHPSQRRHPEPGGRSSRTA